MTTEFNMLGIDRALDTVLAKAGYDQPTEIQTQAIPPLLAKRDVLGIAQTGTGKTAAFGLPLVQKLMLAGGRAEPRRPLALVLAPTRELAVQIKVDLSEFAAGSRLTVGNVFGGVGQNPQVRALARGMDILVGTPGRLLDLLNQGHLDLRGVNTLILDEADRLMDMGFIRDVMRIVKQTPKSRQSALFSATMPAEIARLAADILVDPVRIEVSPQTVTVEKIEQGMLGVANADKVNALLGLLHAPEVRRAIVFTRTKHGADKVARKLVQGGVGAEVIHGNKSQNARTRALASFSGGHAWVLVATDLASRGIDVEGVTHVFNYELPHEPESYVHRIGRTGRAGAAGAACSLVDPGEVKRLKAIERLIGFRIPEVAMPAGVGEEAAADIRRQQRSPTSKPRDERAFSGSGRRRSRGRRPAKRRAA